VIVEVGPRVKGFKKGDRVAYCGVLGAYCQERLMGVDQLVKVPAGVSDEQAAAIMLKGMTTEYLVDRTAKAWLKKGDTILFHAAAGGVGLLFGQWAKARGYKVIGTTSSPEKAALAKKNGYKWVIDYTKQDIVAEVKKITKNKGVPVVFDGVGKDTWAASLDCLQPRGLMVSFGNASGAVTGVNLGILAAKGSLFVTRPTVATHVVPRSRLEASSEEIFDHVLSGAIKIGIERRYALADAAQAHIDLAGRKTTGSCILLP
jgi:NADPH2:quinone reductase